MEDRIIDVRTVPPQERIEKAVEQAFYGLHHVKVRVKNERYWKVSFTGDVSTYDTNYLTRVVLSAHKYGVRFQLCSSMRGTTVFMVHPRATRDGKVWDRHPNILTAMKDFDEGCERNRMPKKKAKQRKPKIEKADPSKMEILMWRDGDIYPHCVCLTEAQKDMIVQHLLVLHEGVIKLHRDPLVGVYHREDPAPTPK